MRKHRAIGLKALELATELLQRARLADPLEGVWEAADMQWSWRKPRRSDEAEKLFWLDDEGPVAGVLLTTANDESWQCDPVVVPHAGVDLDVVWQRAIAHATAYSPKFAVPINDDDHSLRQLALDSGFTADESDSTAWLDTRQLPQARQLDDGFVLIDRTQRASAPHPMQGRVGEGVAQRLAECSLYDPELDLAVETSSGEVAGVSLYWFDPVTKLGLVEPMRVEDAYQRKGLARAMLCAGIHRLAERGAERIKVSYQTEIAGALYLGIGFGAVSTTTWYQAP